MWTVVVEVVLGFWCISLSPQFHSEVVVRVAFIVMVTLLDVVVISGCLGMFVVQGALLMSM